MAKMPRVPHASDSGLRLRRLFGYVLIGLVLAALLILTCRGNASLQFMQRSFQLACIWTPTMFWHTPNTVVGALQASGPVFIKLAQWASTRRDILSSELCDAMAVLHENVICTASPNDLQLAEDVVPGLKVKELLGGGCIAQVYAGEMPGPDGRTMKVAVKVRRAGMQMRLETDVQLLRWIARVVERIWPNLQWLALEDAVEEFGWYLTQQVDLRVEAEHAQRFKKNFEKTATRVPKVIAATESVMVTDVAPGVSLSHFVKQEHPEEIRKMVFESLTDIMARMILRDNFIHGDLHPGNVFISLGPSAGSPPTVTLIDMGIAIEMSPNLATLCKTSMLAALNMNATALGKALIQFHTLEGLCTHALDIDKLERNVGCLCLSGCFMVDESIWGEVFPSWEAYNSTRVSEYFTLMVKHLSQHKVRVSPSLWSIMTAFALIEGSIYELGFGINVLRAAVPYVLDPINIIGRAASALRFAVSQAQFKKEMPDYLSAY